MADQLTRPTKPTLVHLVCASGFYGAERVISNLCQALPQLSTVVLCLSPVPERIAGFAEKVRDSGAQFICVDNQFRPALRELSRIQQQAGPVLLHAHGYKEIVIACAFGLTRGSRVVVTQHGFTRRNVKSRLYNWIDKLFCRWANVDRVIAVSPAILDEYRAFAVRQEKLRLLPNGVTLTRTDPADRLAVRRQLKQSHGIDATAPLVLFAGRLSQEKDPLLFVESMALLCQQRTDVNGIIAGDGPLKDVLLQRIDQLGLNQRIHWLGFVEHMDQLLPAVDLLLLTSETEGTPMSVLEAMATGVAVIAAAVGGLPALIQHQVDGMLVTPREASGFAAAACSLLQSEVPRTRMAEQAREKIAKQFDLGLQCQIYLQDIYALDARQ